MAFEIAPFRALRFARGAGRSADSADFIDIDDVVSPPYDIISPADHRRLLERSPVNIVRLTLGERPGEREGYGARAERLLRWRREGVLVADAAPALHVYGCDYTVPGSSRRASFRGLVALGRLHAFEERVVLPHERTFPDVVDDRFHLLAATRTQLEPIFLLHEDREGCIDATLAEASAGEPAVRVEARPGETHALWPIRDAAAIDRLRELFRGRRPIIADGHHRYTTGLQYRDRVRDDPEARPGSGWQPMVFGNLVGEGLSILATHRLVDCGGRGAEALDVLRRRLEPAGEGDWDLRVETRGGVEPFRIPAAVRAGRSGAAASDYSILHEVILGEWLAPALEAGELPVAYFKEGAGEREALERGEGDLLFRMRPVSAEEFRRVVEGGEVFPHKTTFFYPKLWSGLVLWALEEVGDGGAAGPAGGES